MTTTAPRANHPVAVISYAWWTRSLARDPNVLSRKLKLGSTSFDIIVSPRRSSSAPRSARLLTSGSHVDDLAGPAGWHSYSGQRDESLYVIGRLKPGVSLAQATANINLLFQQVWLSYRDEHVTQKDLADLQKTHVRSRPSPMASMLCATSSRSP